MRSGVRSPSAPPIISSQSLTATCAIPAHQLKFVSANGMLSSHTRRRGLCRTQQLRLREHSIRAARKATAPSAQANAPSSPRRRLEQRARSAKLRSPKLSCASFRPVGQTFEVAEMNSPEPNVWILILPGSDKLSANQIDNKPGANQEKAAHKNHYREY